MIGYWDRNCPVKTGREDVPATVYQREGKTLVALASWATAPVNVKLTIDFKRLGLDPAKTNLYAPPVAGFQGEMAFKPGDSISVAPGRGWLLVLDELPHPIAKAVDLAAGQKTLLEEKFTGDRLAEDWKTKLSTQRGTTVRVAGDELWVEAAANTAAFIERAIPVVRIPVSLPHRPADRWRCVLGAGHMQNIANCVGIAVRLHLPSIYATSHYIVLAYEYNAWQRSGEAMAAT